MLDELTEALEMAEKDTGVRCVILTAAGERAFTAGGDIKEEVQLNETTAAEFSRRGKKMIRSILNHRVPVICAVRGYALGGGMEMILAADITVAATDAKIGIPTIKLGGIPGWGSTVLLPRTVGASRAKELLYTGRSLSAEEALKLGVVEDVVEPDELLKRAFELADTIADMAPLAVENMKKSINTCYERRTGGKPWNRDRYLRFLLWNAGSSGSDDGVSREEGTWGVYEKIEKTLPN